MDAASNHLLTTWIFSRSSCSELCISLTHLFSIFSVLYLAVSKEGIEKIQSIVEASRREIVLNYFVGQNPIRHEFKETDLEILRCLISNPRMEISRIAQAVSVSSKTAGKRLTRMKYNRILNIIVTTDPLKMQGYIRFGITIKFDRKANPKIVESIQSELDYFTISSPVILQGEIASYQLIS